MTLIKWLSHPDHREPFYSPFWLGRGVTRVGNLGILFLCWPGMVPNQKQLFIVVSDCGSYLGSHFPTVFCRILFMCSCLWALHFFHVLFVLYCFGAFHSLNMWNSYLAALWSECSNDNRDSDGHTQHTVELSPRPYGSPFVPKSINSTDRKAIIALLKC
jgi:hypothetical protein